MSVPRVNVSTLLALNAGEAAEIALAALSEGVVMHAASGAIVACNPAAERILGLTRDQMTGRTSIDPRWRAVHEDGSPYPGETHPAMLTLRTGEPVRSAVMGVHWPDGSLRWISINAEPIPGADGRPSGVVATFVDITERKALEETRRREEEFERRLAAEVFLERTRFRTMAENIVEAILLIDHDGSVIWTNRAGSRTLGLDPNPERRVSLAMSAESLGVRDLAGEVIPPDKWPGQRALAGETVAGFYMHLRPVGASAPRTFSVNATPVQDPETRRTQAVVTLRDVTERLAEREALRRSEENLRSFFDALDEYVFVVGNSGRILHASRSAAARLGYTVEELTDRRMPDLHPEDRLDEIAEVLSAVQSGKTSGCSVPIVARGGTRIPVETRMFPGRWHGQEVLFVVCRDLSDLQAAEEKFERLFRSNPCPTVLRSLPGGKVVDVNDAFTAALGYTPEEVVGRTDVGLGLWVNPEGLQGALAKLRDGGTLKGFGVKVRAKDGSLREGQFSAETLQINGEKFLLTVLNDVTELKQVEGELKRHRDHLEDLVAQRSEELLAANRVLRASEERLRLAQEAGKVGTFEWDARTNRVAWSSELERLHGLPVGSFEGGFEAALRTVHPDDVPGLHAVAKKAFRDGGDIQTEFRIVRADGEVRWLELWGKVFRDEEGTPVRMTGVNKDITDRMVAVEALRARERELEAFSYTVSHDLRAPLRAIHGFSTLLERHLGDGLDEEGRRLLHVVEGAASQMGTLVDGLIRYTRIGRAPLSLESVEMKWQVERVLSELARGTGPGLLEVRVGELPSVRADRELAAEVLRQLLSNAIKFSSRRPRPLVEVGFETGPEGGCYFVRDNGVGFEPNYGERVFGVFERLHAREGFDGTGIGLALARRIVERHGGWIRAQGEVDRGATIRFTLGPPLAS